VKIQNEPETLGFKMKNEKWSYIFSIKMVVSASSSEFPVE
jgi:hypothetical protein